MACFVREASVLKGRGGVERDDEDDDDAWVGLGLDEDKDGNAQGRRRRSRSSFLCCCRGWLCLDVGCDGNVSGFFRIARGHMGIPERLLGF
jgi:hypothetical protein